MSTEINWHSHGMAWVLADSADPSGPEEWTAGCLARAYEAGAKQALQYERARIAESLRKSGATLPAPEVKGTPESGIITGLCIALTLVEDGPNGSSQPGQTACRLDSAALRG